MRHQTIKQIREAHERFLDTKVKALESLALNAIENGRDDFAVKRAVKLAGDWYSRKHFVTEYDIDIAAWFLEQPTIEE